MSREMTTRYMTDMIDHVLPVKFREAFTTNRVLWSWTASTPSRSFQRLSLDFGSLHFPALENWIRRSARQRLMWPVA